MEEKKKISRKTDRLTVHDYFQQRFDDLIYEINKLKKPEEIIVIQNLLLKDYDEYLQVTDYIEKLPTGAGRPEDVYLNTTYRDAFKYLKGELGEIPSNKQFCNEVRKKLGLTEDEFELEYRKNVESKYQKLKE